MHQVLASSKRPLQHQLAMAPLFAFLLVLLFLPQLARSRLDAAQTPPLGWRSWNWFLNHIDQDVIMRQVTALASGPLLKAGYSRIGIDGGWVCQNPISQESCLCG